ncbi:aminotransferase class I/II-fold pyridoxal phosphate-dependent enzyme [Clostridium sp. Cult2]|nr:aminotransferase class I/II-fold pyridoxal phosphate-dependent enzyme [Clostridium sp. Cult2]
MLRLKPENQSLPDLDELKSLVTEKTKVICINNPNNPSGS